MVVQDFHHKISMTKIMSKYKNHDVCGGIKMAKSSKNSSVSLHQQY